MMQAYQKYRLLFLLFCIAFCSACQKPNATAQNGIVSEGKTQGPEIPAWLAQRIEEFKQDKPANPPVKIYRYLYRNSQVYYITSRCCDIPSSLFDVEGQQLCQPDGGYTGKGDGKCADFFTKRTDEKLIWEDLRK